MIRVRWLLVATARHPEQLSDLVTRYGAQVRAVPLDVTDAEQARARSGYRRGGLWPPRRGGQ